MTAHLQHIIGQDEYKHKNGELSTIQESQTGIGHRSIRVAGLPTEVTDFAISSALTRYGDVHTITGEQWAKQYRYSKVSTGVR
jgi:ABC-type sulfate transport system substrate-binding protein